MNFRQTANRSPVVLLAGTGDAGGAAVYSALCFADSGWCSGHAAASARATTIPTETSKKRWSATIQAAFERGMKHDNGEHGDAGINDRAFFHAIQQTERQRKYRSWRRTRKDSR